MIYKNFKSKVKNYWRKLENEKNFTVPNETIFRLLNHRKFDFKNKNVLDIGIGDGANLFEFYRRGSKIYGIDIRDSMLKKFYKKHNFPKKNYIAADLNNNFPKFVILSFIFIERIESQIIDWLLDIIVFLISSSAFCKTSTILKAVHETNMAFGYFSVKQFKEALSILSILLKTNNSGISASICSKIS